MTIQTVNLGTAPSGAGGDTFRSTGAKINENFSNPSHAASRYVGTDLGNVMEVGAFGLGGVILAGASALSSLRGQSNRILWQVTAANMSIAGDYPSNVPQSILSLSAGGSDDHHIQLSLGADAQMYLRAVQWGSNIYTPWVSFRTSRNTAIDSNGFIKVASPIVKLFADKIEPNDEAAEQPLSFEKLGIGHYLIKGSSGFAQEGWYVETPKDANGNLLVAVVYEQLENGDISVKTYDYMLNKKGRIVADIETPLDIPENRWIDIRLQELPQPEIEVTDDPQQ